MTAPTTEDLMFDLDLRIVPVEEGRELPLIRNGSTAPDCIQPPGSIRPCTRSCTYVCPTYTCGGRQCAW